MKIRSGFVSNSSASSFIILKDKINDIQRDIIYNHIQYGKDIDDELISKGEEILYEYYEDWLVNEDDISIWCYTTMDNFNLKYLLNRVADIPYEDMIPLGDGDYFYDLYKDEEYHRFKMEYRSKKINKIKSKLK